MGTWKTTAMTSLDWSTEAMSVICEWPVVSEMSAISPSSSSTERSPSSSTALAHSLLEGDRCTLCSSSTFLLSVSETETW